MPHVYEIDVRIPMRDGVALAANLDSRETVPSL